ncbi:MAG: 3-isopropylmalate dehydratase large subunit [Spirochaetaceae bacterium]|jgi:3-isopropylmalate/(R)-2-methylmalate dehydratase large subunit|nr:3-isopropylmalate dehydratase large subunit [Spirochaetaceae bacterium]
MGKTLVEKIFQTHLRDKPSEETWVLTLDAVFCHEITTPLAITDLKSRGLDRVFDPRRIKAVIDHVSPAKDSATAEQGKILRDWTRRHGIGDFFDIGRNGVCHAIFPEKGFVRPGYTIIMGDSHTCTHGAFGAFAAGIGTTDLEVGILKGVCAFKQPRSLRVNLNGKLPGGVYPKDLILAIIARLGVSGATDHVIEFSGPVLDEMSMEGRMTLCNMAVEAGATSGICLPDRVTVDYLWPFIAAPGLSAGPEPSTGPAHGCEGTGAGEKVYGSKEEALADFERWRSDADAAYDAVYDIDCSVLEPLASAGYKPDEVKPIRELEGTRIDQVYIGSCTNGRIGDLRAAAAVIRGKQVAPGLRAILSPATQGVYLQALKEGLIADFAAAGFCVVSPGCGACLGMSNGVLAGGEVCASTTNRNFFGRMGKGGMIYLMSPASAAAAAIAGCIRPAEAETGRGREEP